MRRILCCGDREWTDEGRVIAYFNSILLTPKDTVIHGGCRGADTLAGNIACDCFGLEEHHIVQFPADWSKGKVGGPLRNAQMLREGKPTEVVAFHDNIQNSRGTADMINQAKAINLPITLVTMTEISKITPKGFF